MRALTCLIVLNKKISFEIILGTFYRPCLVLTIVVSVFWRPIGAYPLILPLVVLLKEIEIPIDASWPFAVLGVYQLGAALFGLVISIYVSRLKYYLCSGICMFIGTFAPVRFMHLKKFQLFMDVQLKLFQFICFHYIYLQ